MSRSEMHCMEPNLITAPFASVPASHTVAAAHKQKEVSRHGLLLPTHHINIRLDMLLGSYDFLHYL